MAENDSGTSGVNHNAGSFAQNNSGSLPDQDGGQQPSAQQDFAGSRDALTQAEHDALQQTEAERRAAIVGDPYRTQTDLQIDTQDHQPAPEHNMESDLPYSEEVDRASHYDKQNKLHQEASKDRGPSTETERLHGPPKREIMTKEDFYAARGRSSSSRGQGQSQDQ